MLTNSGAGEPAQAGIQLPHQILEHSKCGGSAQKILMIHRETPAGCQEDCLVSSWENTFGSIYTFESLQRMKMLREK